MADPNPTITCTSPLPAVGLVRCSTESQEHSTKDQEAEIRAWAKESGHTLLKVFGDEGVSGSELDRPGIRALLSYLESSDEKGTLVCWKRNRLARPGDPRDGLLLERQIERTGWRIHFLHGASASGNTLVDTLMGVIEHHQGGEFLRNLSVDVIRGQVRRILAGDVPGGPPPYGFAKVIVGTDGTERHVRRTVRHRKMQEEEARWVAGDPGEVETVQRIFRRYASGEVGLRSLAVELNEDEIPAPQGGQWNDTTVRLVLRNRSYLGELVWNKSTCGKFFRVSKGKAVAKRSRGQRRNDPDDWVRVPDHHEALVERRLFDKANRLLSSRAKKSGSARKVKKRYPLSGLVFCTVCGSGMHGFSQVFKRSARYHYERYKCGGYSHRQSCEPYQVDRRGLERAILTRLQEAYAVDPELLPALRRKVPRILRRERSDASPTVDVQRLEKERGRLQSKIEQAVQNMGHVSPKVAGRISEQIDAWDARCEEITRELAEAGEQPTGAHDVEQEAEEVLALLEDLASASEDATPEELRLLFQRVVHRVELTFETEPPAKGRKRKRHKFLFGDVEGTALLESLQLVVRSVQGDRKPCDQKKRSSTRRASTSVIRPKASRRTAWTLTQNRSTRTTNSRPRASRSARTRGPSQSRRRGKGSARPGRPQSTAVAWVGRGRARSPGRGVTNSNPRGNSRARKWTVVTSACQPRVRRNTQRWTGKP